MNLGVGSEIELTCGDAVPGGRVLARHEGKIVLVAGALPGERVVARVTKESKSLAEADVTAVHAPHEARRTPPCPHAAECGGCDFQHASRSAQLAMKRSIVIDAFRRIGKIDVGSILEGPTDAVPEFGARTRIRLSIDSAGRPGLLRRASHDVVPIADCMLMTPAFGKSVLPWIRLLPPWSRAAARFDSDQNAVILLESEDGSEGKEHRRLAKRTKETERSPGIVGILADGVPLAGRRELVFRMRGKELATDAASFFQGSVEGAVELVRVVEEMIGADRRGQLLDLYAGSGLLSVGAGDGFAYVVASDAEERAVRMLRRNLERHGIPGEARAEEAQVTLRKAQRMEVETVIVDPPRTGMEKVVRQALVERGPRRIVAVSCDPATGARDTADLLAAGYRLERITALDLFPVTAHVETVALLRREGAASNGESPREE